MEFHKDFAELCSLLNAQGVEFLIVGGYAVAFHGAPRFTGDMDLLVRPAKGPILRVLEALQQFGFPTAQVTAEHLLERQKILQLGREPVQVHIMTSITGVSWEEAWGSRKSGFYGDVPVNFIGVEALIANKKAVGRMKDLADVEALRPPESPATADR